MRFESYVIEIEFIVFFILVLRTARVIFGREQTSLFLWGSIIWTGAIENICVMTGCYDYFAYVNHYSFAGRLLNGYGGWFSYIFVVPTWVCLGWFALSVPAFVISQRLLRGKNIWIKTFFASIILVSFDMLEDPIAVVNEWWRWTFPGYFLHGVNIGNYVGWFWILFFFGVLFERTVLERKGFRLLQGIERKIFHVDTSDLSGMDMKRVGTVFYFRIVAFIPIFFICASTVVNMIALLFANNLGPFQSVFPNNLWYLFLGNK